MRLNSAQRGGQTPYYIAFPYPKVEAFLPLLQLSSRVPEPLPASLVEQLPIVQL
jgi:hypothetical protein